MRESLKMTNEQSELLKQGALFYGVQLNDSLVEKFNIYMELLKEWNGKMNLTSIEDDKDIIVKHFIDSFSILPYLKGDSIKLVDVGTGAGFPGIPIKIVRPDIKLTLVDSLDKRVKYLNAVISALNLKDVTCIHSRAEDIGVNPLYREKFDFVTARAVASMKVLLEYCVPLVKVNGKFIAMKGSNPESLLDFEKAMKELGGVLEATDYFVLHNTDIERNIYLIKKVRQTPTKYPRKAGIPSKCPII